MAKKKNIKSTRNVSLKKNGSNANATRKPSKYNIILKQFTKLNDKLPEDRKLSIKERRKIIKEKLLPLYENVPTYKIRVKNVKGQIIKIYDKLPPKEICDINYLDTSEFALVEWYSLDETISELVPDCVYVKVTAGEYGSTKIFNTRNYEYGRKGVRDIVEAIRPEARNSSGRFVFSAYRKLRPNKRNNGDSENYYLDFVLFIVDNRGNEEPLGETEEIVFELPRTREVRKKRTKVKNVIEAKIKSLKSRKDSKRRAKKTLERNIKKLTQISGQVAKRPTLNKEILKTKQFSKTASLLEKYYKEGKYTKLQYEKELEKILKQQLREK